MRSLQRGVVACLLGTLPAVVPLAHAQTEPGGTAAQIIQKSSITLAQAIERAMGGSPVLRAAAHEIEATEGQLEQAGSFLNPEFSYQMEDTRPETRTNTYLLSQPLELGGKRTARIEAARHGRAAADIQLTARRAELHARVGSKFREVLAAQMQVRLADEALVLAQRGTQATTRRVQAGSASPVEESRARIEESTARVAQSQAQITLAVARNALASLWGQGQADFERAEGRLEDLPAVPVAEQVLARIDDAPTYQLAARAAQQREAMVAIERSRRYPDVTVSVGMKRDAEVGRNQAVLGVSIPLPLFDRNGGNVREAVARAGQARDEQDIARQALVTDTLAALGRLRASRQEAESLSTEVLPGAQSALDAATRGYELGKFGFLDVLDAQRTLSQVRTQHLRALVEAHAAASELSQLLGELPASPANMTTSAR